METIRGKKIILGVCGSIAAYKAAFLLRLLTKAGAEVQVIMTPDAVHFITPLTLSTLSGKPVLVDYFDEKTGEWNNHVHLALWADVILVAPASANTLSKFAAGACDNLLAAVYLSARSPVFLAPAMDLDMWKHPATQSNISALLSIGHHLIAPENGELASGLVGEGRLAEPEEIIQVLAAYFENVEKNAAVTGSFEENGALTAHAEKSGMLTAPAEGDGLSPERSAPSGQRLRGKNVLVTAGPTYEAIDPVRFIGNHSSGKMGFALAQELAAEGAGVTLVHGPVSVPVPEHPLIRSRAVVTADDMLTACLETFDGVDIVVMAAAVADYTPVETAAQKIKKSPDAEGELQIPVKKTTDILAALGQRKKDSQFLVGFALETEKEEEHALSKLQRKNLDLIVLNSLRDEGAGFGTDTNKITVFDRSGQRTQFPLRSKQQVAGDIIQMIIDRIG